MTLTKIIHLKPNKKCPDGVQDYQDILISSLNQLNGQNKIQNRLSFLEIKLNEFIFYRNINNEQTFIHCQLPMRAWRFNLLLPIIVLLKLMNRKNKLIITLHEWSNTHPLRRLINLILLNNSYFIIVPSEEISKELKILSFIKKRKIDIYVIPIGPNIILKDPSKIIQYPKGKVKEQFLIGHFGFLYPLKNPGKLLLVFNEINKKYNNATLIFIGDFLNSKSNEKHQFNMLISKLNLNDHIQFLGYLKTELAVLTEMNSWDIYVSLHENGFSLRHGSTLAALQMGIPVISYEPKNIFSEFEKNWLNCIMKDRNLIFISKDLTISEIAEITIRKLNDRKARNVVSLDWIWDEISKMHLNTYSNYILNR